MPVPRWLTRRDHVLWDTADVIVKRVGEEAYAIKTETREVITHSTNHRKVLQKAIDETSAIGGGIVRVKGVIEIDDYLIPKRNVMLVGVGDYIQGTDTVQGDVIRAKTSMESLFVTDEYVENFRIIGLALDGNNLAQKAFKHTQGYHIKILLTEICRVLVKGVESTTSGGFFIAYSRISASKSATSPEIGIELRTDSFALINAIRAFSTGIRATTGGNLILGNHPFSEYGRLDVGIEAYGSIVAFNYIDGYHVVGIRAKGWGTQIIGNWIVTYADLGSDVDAPYIEIDLDSPGTIGDIIIVGNIGSIRSGTSILHAIKFGDNVNDAYEIYEYGNRWTGYSSLTNNEKLLTSSPFRIPVLSDCANIRNGAHKGEITLCYDTSAGKWVLKVWDGSAWQTIS